MFSIENALALNYGFVLSFFQRRFWFSSFISRRYGKCYMQLDATMGFQALGLTVSGFAFAGVLVNFFARDTIRNPAFKTKIPTQN